MAGQALRNQMTRTVVVDRKHLLEILKTNREKHLREYSEAMAGYKAMALRKIEESFAGIHTRIDKRKAELVEKIGTFSPETADKFSDMLLILQAETIPLKVPESFVDAYDTAIDIATFDVRNELELTGAEFQCFCRDVWEWTHDFSVTNSAYTR